MKKTVKKFGNFSIKVIPHAKSNNTTLTSSRPSSTISRPRIRYFPSKNESNRKMIDYVYYDQCESKSPSVIYCFGKANEFFGQRKYDFSKHLFKKVTEIEPESWRSWNNLGVCNLLLGNLNEGINNLHTVLNIDKGIESSYFNICLGFYSFNKLQEAELCINSAKLIFKELSTNFKKLQEVVTKQKEIKKLMISGKNRIKINSFKDTDSRSAFLRKKKTKKNTEIKEVLSKSVMGFNQTNALDRKDHTALSEILNNPLGENLKKLREKVYKKMKDFLKEKIPEGEKLESKNLTQQELKNIKVEFVKPKNERDYEVIDEVLQKLLFFRNFPKDVRIKIYEIGDIEYFLPGEYVFQQGEAGEGMYVILKGSITIMKKSKEFGNYDIVINSLYDGKAFGELALLNSIQKKNASNERTATCVACEKTYLLCMPKLSYSEILLMNSKKELDVKLDFLSKSPLFKGVSTNLLVALATNIEKVQYTFDDVILVKGENPKGLFIISKGCITLYTESTAVKNTVKYSSPPKNQKKKPSPMYFSLTPPAKYGKNLTTTSQSSRLTARRPIKNPILDQNLDQTEEKELVPHSTMQIYDHFGASTILEGYYNNNEKNVPNNFTIIAHSLIVELYLITRYHLQFLTQEVLMQFMSRLEDH